MDYYNDYSLSSPRAQHEIGFRGINFLWEMKQNESITKGNMHK